MTMGPVATTRVGNYKLGHTLGSGSFGKVKYATHVESGKAFAIKILDKERVLRYKQAELVKLEISITKRLKHPNIVELYEVLATKTKIYLVMEYVPGGVLFDKLMDSRQGGLRESQARLYFQQLIEAVEHCHSRGVYHRDLKPENLLLDAEGNLKVSDFGLSALLSRQMNNRDGLLHTVCGTPNYMAPEIICSQSKGYDGAKADIWACGVILFALISCRLPFADSNLAGLCKKICEARLGFPSWFSPGARSLIKGILVPDPKKRMSIAHILDHPWLRQIDEKGASIVRNYSLDNCQDMSQISYDVYAALSSKSVMIHNCNTININTRSSSAASSGESDCGIGYIGTGISSAITSTNEEPKPQPALINAFELISSLNKGLDLSGLLPNEEREQVEMESSNRFTSTHPAPMIISKMEETAKPLGFTVHKQETYKMKLQQINNTHMMRGNWRSRQDQLLSIAAQIFQIAPTLFLVEVKKDGGNSFEYRKFYQNFSNGLKDIMWSPATDVVAGY